MFSQVVVVVTLLICGVLFEVRSEPFGFGAKMSEANGGPEDFGEAEITAFLERFAYADLQRLTKPRVVAIAQHLQLDAHGNKPQVMARIWAHFHQAEEHEGDTEGEGSEFGSVSGEGMTPQEVELERMRMEYKMKELLALVLSIQHFEVYAGNGRLTVFTDHNPLTFLEKFKHKSQRLFRWSLILQPYSLDVKHIKGQHNVIADCLSRV